MEATGSSIRYRANVTRNSKGYSVDWTVERTFPDDEIPYNLPGQIHYAAMEDEVLEALRSFGAKLEAAYPATVAPERAAVNGGKE